jgi:anti-sigma factor RsiW
MIRRLLARRNFMREHRWTHAHLSGYLDGELATDERERVEAHARICPQCGRVLATLRRTVEGLRELTARPRREVAEGAIRRLREEG